MITIPTGDFVGVLSDVLPFASTDADDTTWHAVRVFWDGGQFHAQACDRIALGWSSWDPDDPHNEEHQDTIFTKWGGGDLPWSVTLDLPDAKALVNTYKLSGKGVYYVPLTVERLGTALRVQRMKESGHAAVTTVAPSVSGEYPDLARLLADNDRVTPVDKLNFGAKRLALFAKVRQTDHMQMTFTGDTGLVRVTIGERFVGAIQPVRDTERMGVVTA